MFTFQNNHSGHGVRDVQCPTGGPVTTNSIILASDRGLLGRTELDPVSRVGEHPGTQLCPQARGVPRRTLCSGEYLVGQRYCNPR